MANGQTVILRSDTQRAFAKRMIDLAPADAVVNVQPAKRTGDQNARMWAMLSDIARSKPQGRVHTADTWKSLAMHACGHAVQFEMGLDGQPFPTGFRTSRLTKAQMGDLITWLDVWGSENGVRWSDNNA